jgi:glycogen debranching enzyme
MATMIGTYDYFLYSGDKSFLSANWAKYQSAMAFITNKIDHTGMLDVTGTNDWGRIAQGGHNTEANMLLYKVLTTGSSLATWMNDASYSDSLLAKAATLKAAVNNASNNWDPSVGLVA